VLDKDKPYIFEVQDVLTPQECRAQIQRIESLKPTLATNNSALGPRINTDVRNNERVIFDDAEMASRLLDRVREKVPDTFHEYKLVGVNERFRSYRYKPGMRFAPHPDGAFHRNNYEQSFYTFMVYLNEDFTGGNTTFFTEPQISIRPQTGKALFFQHPIIHEGSVVTSGVKYVLRTDLMYREMI
jgi:hypothetical protein